MGANHIQPIMDSLDKIVSEDRLRRFSNAIMVKIIVIQQIYGILYISSGKFFNNHPELLNLVGINKIPNFRTLSYRALRMGWHETNAGIIESDCENAAIDSLIVKTCKYSTAQ